MRTLGCVAFADDHCWLLCCLVQTITNGPDDAIPSPAIEPVEITLQEAHHSRCEGLLVSIVGTCIQTALIGGGAWSLMDGTGFAQVMQSEGSFGADVVPVRCAVFTLYIMCLVRGDCRRYITCAADWMCAGAGQLL